MKQNTDILQEFRELPSAILVALVTRDTDEKAANRGLDELERLLDTAGGAVFARVTQNKDTPDPATVIGSGKVKELGALAAANDVSLLIFDMELTPAQIRNLEDGLKQDGHEVRVIDRSMLILDIFALHAVTLEGKVQVELAQLRYTAPRLIGRGLEMSRLGGGIGTRGPGESQLENDRRHMQRRIHSLEEQLSEMEKNRQTLRAARAHNPVPRVAIVGYTNAGKSTLLNRLTGAGILAEDKLFATLDPTTRQYVLPGGDRVMLTDTVGFIRKLPHHLVEAFKSTLEEAALADILLLLVDASDPECRDELACTEEILESLGAGNKPKLYVFNQCDKPEAREAFALPGKSAEAEDAVFISARTGEGIETLTEKLTALVHAGKTRVLLHIPNRDAGIVNSLYASGASVVSVEYGDEYITADAVVDARTRGMVRKYEYREEN